MIENLNDALSIIALSGLLLYLLYLVLRGINYRRLERHIRSEQRYYRQWLDEEEQTKALTIGNGGNKNER
ncbi:MAG: hypothetical protein IIY44_06975 [Erysipelotrichales bacterium]|nr:hypothetical protein [Erysipelotrichales bacterium]MBQ1385960.1 hypothetical protein [Erysipelotrichales bacterium]MBQ2309833.1 hypothetical protein [Erysipelotrichales bacterium]MBQ2479387.1 hypothetical protein [Erysipelotrichales bacterium]MBQ4374761.1 hypothetical protein [Erysipelotrichales bacterium]